MNNLWTDIKVAEYEGHMKFIKQYELLNCIFKEQLSAHQYKTIGILGIGCGNGLEYIKPNTIVYGYDINSNFLNECRSRYENSNYKLILNKIDLTDKKAEITSCDILISNLVVEYIGKYNFIRIINNSKPRYVSVVLQMTFDKEKAISYSPYIKVLQNISSIRTEIFPQDLTSTFDLVGYQLVYSKTYNIDQFKSFIRMDFSYLAPCRKSV